MAWPLCAPAQAADKPVEPAYGLAVTDADNDPLRLWFREQDKLLDGILLRLARIEILVSDIHRLVSQLPSVGQAIAPPPSRSTPTEPLPAPAATTSSLMDWLPQIAGGTLLIAILLLVARRRAKPAKTAAAAVPPAPTVAPAKASPQPSATPAPASAPKPRSSAAPSIGESPAADQALELAEIMLSMGLGRGAAQTLAEQIRHEPKQALRQWLKLLEIYRENGQQEEFEKSAEELRLHFNVQPEDWQVRRKAIHSIEEYPHIAARLTDLWGKPACLNYLANLLGDNRGGARAGFPQAVAEELLMLSAMLRASGITPEANASQGTG